MSKFDSSKIISFRQFNKLDIDTYVSFELAWPVEVIECYANKVIEGTLDALSEAVLELLTVPEMSRKKIVENLFISDEIVDKIMKLLDHHKFYSLTEKKVTEAGTKYIKDKETGVFQEEKVFGNMFISKIDREVFPYFYEGQLPWAQYEERIQYLSYDSGISDVVNFLDKVNRAYHKYGRIYKASREFTENGFNKFGPDFFVEGELKERSFDSEEVTLADVEQKKMISSARIKVLKTQRREIYVKARLCVSKAAPEKFLIESPFRFNKTQWYTDCFARMRVDNRVIYDVNGEEIDLDYYCDEITTQFFVDYPDMQGTNYEQYIKINFPKMLSISISKECLGKYHEVFNLNLLCNEKNVIKEHVVITESAKAIEMIFNNYIFRTQKDRMIQRYEQVVSTVDELEDMFLNFDIKDSSAFFKERNNIEQGGKYRRKSIMDSFRYDRNGQTIVEKYFYLVAEANYNEKSHFRKLLLAEGSQLIAAFDYLNLKRNKFGAHNDGIKPDPIPKEDYVEFQKKFKYVTKMLIEYLD